MALSKETVKQVADLARIQLKDEEIATLSHQLEHILDFIDTLSKADTSSVAPTSHILALQNVLREDSPKPSIGVSKALENAPRPEGNFYTVPRVIE